MKYYSPNKFYFIKYKMCLKFDKTKIDKKRIP